MLGTLEWWPLQSGQGHWSQGSDLASPGFLAGLWGAVGKRPQGAKGWPSEASHSLPYAPQLWQAQTSGLDPSGELWSHEAPKWSLSAPYPHSVKQVVQLCPSSLHAEGWQSRSLPICLAWMEYPTGCPTPPPLFWVKATYCSPSPSLHLANSYIPAGPIPMYIACSSWHIVTISCTYLSSPIRLK